MAALHTRMCTEHNIPPLFHARAAAFDGTGTLLRLSFANSRALVRTSVTARCAASLATQQLGALPVRASAYSCLACKQPCPSALVQLLSCW